MRGGSRPGAGRKKGSCKPESERVRRKSRSVAAFDDEWELIQRFAQIVKYGDKVKCSKFLDKVEKKNSE